MTYPHPPGSGDPVPPPDPIQPYQPPQAYQPEYPPYGYGPVQQPPPPAYTYDYGYGGGGYYGPPRTQQTDGFAIASLVVSCVSILGLCTWGIGSLLGVLGAIFGHVAQRRIRASGAGGSGIALAGIIIGWVITALGVLLLTFFIVMIVTSDDPSF